jgi:sugar phosphate permease
MKRAFPFFYGWYLVAICIVSMIFIYGIRHSFAVFFSPMLEEFGWSRGDTAMMMSLNILTYGFMAPIAGVLGDRWRPRVLIPFGIVILGVSTAGCTFATRLWHFYFLFGFLMSIGTALSGWPIFAPALMNWFVRRRGLVLGLGSMGSGLSFVYSILVEISIRHLGWRHTFLGLSLILVVTLLPLLFLFFFYHPQDKDMLAYGAENLQPPQARSRVNKKGDKNEVPSRGGLILVIRTKQLWFLVASHSLYWGIAGYTVIAHQVRFLQDKGFSSAFSTSIYGLLGIMIVFGQLSGFLSDWLGREKVHTLATCLSIGGLWALIAVNEPSQTCLLYTFAALFGYGLGLVLPLLYAASADIYHERHFGAVAGFVLGGMGVGSVLGPWLGGFLYDIFGNYKFTFLFCMISLALSTIFLWFAAPRKTSLRMANALDTGLF